MIGRMLNAAVRVAFAIAAVLVPLGIWRSPRESADGTTRAQAPARPSLLRQGLLWAAAFLVIAGIGGAAVVVSGIVPIKASSGHWAITEWFMQFAKRRSVSTHTLGTSVPDLGDPALVLKGAGHYDLGCRACHGSPDFAQPTIASYMTPVPPNLQQTVTGYDPAELFYIVKHGIKLTGMPAWPASGRDDEVWAMVAFLRELPALDPEEYRRLVHGEVEATGAGMEIEDLIPDQVPPAITESCGRCHGVDGLGRGTGAFPRLAGQRAAYLYATMEAFANGERHSGIMGPVAAGLDPADRRAIAGYYAGLPEGRSAAAGSQQPADIAEGESIATRGIAEQLVPPCVKCHGPTDQPRNPHYPRLAGQYADYLVLQLTLFKEQRRGGTAYSHLMRKVAGQLTEEQMRAVAAYFASLPPEG